MHFHYALKLMAKISGASSYIYIGIYIINTMWTANDSFEDEKLYMMQKI